MCSLVSESFKLRGEDRSLLLKLWCVRFAISMLPGVYLEMQNFPCYLRPTESKSEPEWDSWMIKMHISFGSTVVNTRYMSITFTIIEQWEVLVKGTHIRCDGSSESKSEGPWGHSVIFDFATSWTVQYLKFSRPKLKWVAFPFSRDLPNPGIEPRSPTLQVDSLPAEPHGMGQGRLSKLRFKGHIKALEMGLERSGHIFKKVIRCGWWRWEWFHKKILSLI